MKNISHYRTFIFIAAFLFIAVQALPAQDDTNPVSEDIQAENHAKSDAALIPGEKAESGLQEPNDHPNAASYNNVYLITMHQMIDGGLTSSVKRRVDAAKENGADLIIFDIDTFGGRLDSGMEISEYLSDLKNIKTVAFISNKAISAGALIAVSCNNIVMEPDAELGDCEPIIPSSEGGYKTAGEKIQTVLRTKFRKFAERNGYPVLLAEAMVTSEIEIYKIYTDKHPEGVFISSRELKEMSGEDRRKIKSKKLIVEEGKLLTMHGREAHEYGFAGHLVDDRDALLRLYNINQASVTELATNWSEEMVRFLEKIAPILMTLGIIAIYIEFKTPGFGLPGILGILCFAAIFLSKNLVGLAETPEIIIFFVGVALLAVEIFLIPGFGVAGIVGVALMAMGLILSFQDFTIPRTPYDSEVLRHSLLMIIGSFLAASIVITLLMKFVPGIPIFNRIVLTTEETPDFGFKDTKETLKPNLIGKQGNAITPLHPAGKVEIGETTLDVVTQGDFINKGQTVEIVEAKGNHIVVKAV